MTLKRRNQIRALLKGIETGDPASVSVVNPAKYIQHNPQTREGGEGLASLFARLARSSPKVNIVRAFSDGDFVFAHTEYDFTSQRVGFEVFRFEGDFAVEHWDNIQSRQGPNLSGHTMVDGPTEVSDSGQTEASRELVRGFVTDVLIGREVDKLALYVDGEHFTEHNPRLADGLESLSAALSERDASGSHLVRYRKLHHLLAQGDFVLCASEGYRADTPTAYYDLFRIDNGKLVEHWDTTEKIVPREEWQNENGKF